MKNSNKDCIYREEGDLKYISSKKMNNLTDKEYFEDLLYNVHDIMFCKISANDKTAMFMKNDCKQRVLERYFGEAKEEKKSEKEPVKRPIFGEGSF